MGENINMDKSIREKLESFSATPPPHLWNNIQGQMAAQKKRRRIAYMGWISAAAVVVFAFMAGWYFSNQSNEILPDMVEQELTKPEVKTTSPGKEPAQAPQEEEVLGFVASNEDNDKSEKATEKVVVDVSTISDESDLFTSAKPETRESYSLLAKIEALLGWDTAEQDLMHVPKKQTETDALSEADELLIAENVKKLEGNKEKENGWIVGAHVAPAYSSHSASHKETYSNNMQSSSSNGNGNVGAGFSVQYKTNKRLKVESGVYYAKNGHEANSSPSLFGFKNDADYLMAPELSTGAGIPTYSNAVKLSSNGIEMNSTAGVINMRSTPKGAEITSNLESLNGRYDNTLVADGELSQVFEFIEVPLYLRYSILDKKLGVELMGGFNAGFVVGNNAYLDNQFGAQNIGKTEDISTVNVSGTVGVGLNYIVGKHFSLALEPRFNYYLNSINTSSDVDFRPYRVGLYTGIYYEF